MKRPFSIIVNSVVNTSVICMILAVIIKFPNDRNIDNFHGMLLLLVMMSLFLGQRLGEWAIKMGLKRNGTVNPFEFDSAADYINSIKNSTPQGKPEAEIK